MDQDLPILNSLNDRRFPSSDPKDDTDVQDGDVTPMPTEAGKRFSWSKIPGGHTKDSTPGRRRDTPRPTHDKTGRKFSWSNEDAGSPSYDATDPPSPVPMGQAFTLSMEREVDQRLTGSSDLSDSGDTVKSRGFSTYSTSLPHAIVEENTTQAVGKGESNLDSNRDTRVSLSIRKLQSLTFSDSSTSVKSDSAPSVKKPSKKASRIRKTPASRRAITTTQIPHVANRVLDEDPDPDEDDNPMKQPKFFTSDMLSIITERNELKETVLQLEEKVKQLER